MQFKPNQNGIFQKTIPNTTKKKFDRKIGNFPT